MDRGLTTSLSRAARARREKIANQFSPEGSSTHWGCAPVSCNGHAGKSEAMLRISITSGCCNILFL
jgi:hypothetical protein